MWNQVQEALNQSTASVLTGLAKLLPGTIALAVSLLLAVAIGSLLAFVLRRVLLGLGFDRRVAAWGWFDVVGWTGMDSPALLLARLLLWGVILFGFVVGLSAFDPTLTSELALRLFGSAINLLTALIILIVGNVLARFLSRSVVISLVNMNIQHARALSLAVKWLVVILATAMALDHVGIGGSIVKLAFAILFGGIVLTLSLTVAIRSKDLAEWSLGRKGEKPEERRSEPFQHL